LSELFLEPSILAAFFNDYVFTATFLSFVFEASLRPFILSKLLSHWTRASVNEINPDFPRIISGIIEMASNSLPSDPAGHLVADVLDILNEAMMHKRSLSSQLISLLPAIFRSWKG
jgi:hypothetical protein